MKAVSVGRRRLLSTAAAAAGGLVLTGLTSRAASASPRSDTPDFGPNVKIFDPATPVEQINAYLQGIASNSEFSDGRYAVLFKPGTYGSAKGENDPATATGIVNSRVGYYTSVQGLGAHPDDVTINGALHADPSAGAMPSSLTTFWRSLSNLAVNPIQRPVPTDPNAAQQVAAPHTLRWNVSQASPLRRVHIKGDLHLNGVTGAYAFGSEMANSKVDGTVISGDGATQMSMAQWYTRDSRIGSWSGSSVNMVFSGVEGAPATDFAPGDKTTLATTPVSKEAPFLYLDGRRYKVFVPDARRDSRGTQWSTSSRYGRQIPIGDFFIAKPADSAKKINAALAAGRHLLVTPGIYHLDRAIRITRPHTVVMGLGYATLTPTGGNAVIEVGDVDGVTVAGLTVDAGATPSEVLVRVGSRGTRTGSPRNPTSLIDLYVRVGGPREGSATTSVEINTHHTLLDNTWLWRGDYGTGVGWTVNLAAHGLVVNGDDVTALGLFVEHYQREQVIWNGEGGQTLFYQNELPYDVPSQDVWKDGASDGYAAYVVSPRVRTHTATGLAVYSFFRQTLAHAETAIQTPTGKGIRLTSLTTGVIAGQEGIRHVVNDTGAAVDADRPGSYVYGLTALTQLKRYAPGAPAGRD